MIIFDDERVSEIYKMVESDRENFFGLYSLVAHSVDNYGESIHHFYNNLQ